jgi:hypothetical protein
MSEHNNSINVVVTFPIAEKPFNGEFAPTATVDEVRTASMESFGVNEDASTKYYLSHDSDKLSESQTLEAVVGNAKAVKFTLVKEITQGGN